MEAGYVGQELVEALTTLAIACWVAGLVMILYTKVHRGVSSLWRSLHGLTMLTAIVLDLTVTLLLVFQAEAFQKAAGMVPFAGSKGLLYFHISVATGLLVAYAVILLSGLRKYSVRGDRLHFQKGVITLAFYLGALITAPKGPLVQLFELF